MVCMAGAQARCCLSRTTLRDHALMQYFCSSICETCRAGRWYGWGYIKFALSNLRFREMLWVCKFLHLTFHSGTRTECEAPTRRLFSWPRGAHDFIRWYQNASSHWLDSWSICSRWLHPICSTLGECWAPYSLIRPANLSLLGRGTSLNTCVPHCNELILKLPPVEGGFG